MRKLELRKESIHPLENIDNAQMDEANGAGPTTTGTVVTIIVPTTEWTVSTVVTTQ